MKAACVPGTHTCVPRALHELQEATAGGHRRSLLCKAVVRGPRRMGVKECVPWRDVDFTP